MGRLQAKILSGPHDTIRASDGRAELLVPQGTFPVGTKAGDLRIQSIDPAKSLVMVDGKPPRFAYELTPDGLRFSAPSVLRVTTTMVEDGSLPTLFSYSENKVEWLPMDIDRDLPKKQVTVSAAIGHFISVVDSNGWASINFPNRLADHKVGESFEWLVTITAHTEKEGLIGIPIGAEGRTTWEGRLNKDSTLAGEWDANARAIRPAIASNAPPTTILSAGSFTAKQVFTGVGKGKMDIRDGAVLQYSFLCKGVDGKSLGTQSRSSTFSLYNNEAQCEDSVTPAKAVFTQETFSTAYVVDLANPSGQAVTYKWDGPNCGGTTGESGTSSKSDPLSMTWSHPHPPCEKTTDHGDVTVGFTAEFPAVVARCTCQGSGSGTGPDCKYIPK